MRPPCLLRCTGRLTQQQLVATNEATGAASWLNGCTALCTRLAHIVVITLIVLAFVRPMAHWPGLLCSCQAQHCSKQHEHEPSNPWRCC